MSTEKMTMRSKKERATEILDKNKINIRQDFDFWLEKETTLFSTTRENYLKALDDLEAWWNKEKKGKIEIWRNPYPFIEKYTRSALFDNTELGYYDKKERGGNGAISAAFTQYNKFLEIYANRLNIRGINKLYFGAPGSGKSYQIRNFIQNNGMPEYDERNDYENVVRVTLHPEYSYSDFIGHVMPVTKSIKEENIITYDFKAGPFTFALDYAINHENQIIFLILEELSRANVAAVFGDIFQLLDREEDGVSEYSIRNDMIAKYIYTQPNKNIRIPRNLFLLGTVNTSDQNIFVMDTAFKRRFEFEYIDANELALDSSGNALNNYTFNLKEDEDSIKFNWINLYQALNRFIVSENSGLGLPEDKQLGQFFIKFIEGEEERNYDQIVNKLIEYLWSDVQSISYSERNLFKTGNDGIDSFSQLYNKAKNNENFFSNEFLDIYLRLIDDDKK